jgi:hypothetical protein
MRTRRRKPRRGGIFINKNINMLIEPRRGGIIINACEQEGKNPEGVE